MQAPISVVGPEEVVRVEPGVDAGLPPPTRSCA